MPTTHKPKWKKNPQPGAGLYVNSVGISGDGSAVVGGTYFYDYKQNNNHTTAQPSYTVGVFVWNAKGKLQWQDKFTATEGVYWVAMSRDAGTAAAGGLSAHSQGFIYAYAAADGTKQLSDTTSSRVNMVALSTDGNTLVAGSNSLRVYTRTGGTWSAAQIVPNATGDHTVAVGISDDGKWICAGTFQGRVLLIQNTGGVLSTPAVWQQPSGEIYWMGMAADGSYFVAAAKNATVCCFNTATFAGTPSPAWQATLTGCARCGSAAISGDGNLVSAVGNKGTAGKVFVYANQGTSGKALWNSATTSNPNSTSWDAAGTHVTVADGYPDGVKGTFYLFDAAGNLQWTSKAKNMCWPMQIDATGAAVAAGSDDGNVYYFV